MKTQSSKTKRRTSPKPRQAPAASPPVALSADLADKARRLEADLLARTVTGAPDPAVNVEEAEACAIIRELYQATGGRVPEYARIACLARLGAREGYETSKGLRSLGFNETATCRLLEARSYQSGRHELWLRRQLATLDTNEGRS